MYCVLYDCAALVCDAGEGPLMCIVCYMTVQHWSVMPVKVLSCVLCIVCCMTVQHWCVMPVKVLSCVLCVV